MTTIRRQLFIGVIDNETWTNEKLRAYLVKHVCTNDDQYITDCQMMSYNEARFQGKSFAFVTFTDETCVDRCMEKRHQFNEEYGITMKRLLPDSTTKCERLMSTPDVVIRIKSFDSLFTDTNIRSYFSKYGKIMDLKMLEEENTGGICFITFEDFDSSDRVILDAPHYLNNQLLSINKYTTPEYICSLSQFRFIDQEKAHEIKRWYPLVRNFTDFIRPLEILYRTQLALIKYNINKQITIGNQNLNQTKENLVEFENKYNDVKQNLIQLRYLTEQLKKQIDESQRKNDTNKNEYEYQIEQQRQKNRLLENEIKGLQDKS